MAKQYKWSSPGDWLGDRINDRLATALVPLEPGCDAFTAVHDLAVIANSIVNGTMAVDSDTIQDAFQDEMSDDGYFDDTPEWKAEKLREKISRLNRERLVEILQAHEIQCYDVEDKATLLEALAVNIEDETIQEGALGDD